MQLYSPNKKIVLASSFEGVLNNGAKECGVVSLVAYRKMVQAGQLRDVGNLLQRDESKVMKAFLALRPLVAVAEDYLNVLQLVAHFPVQIEKMSKSDDLGAQKFLCERYEFFKSIETEARAIFSTEFYAERKSRQDSDYRGWLALQEPYAETIEQFRQLNALKTFDHAAQTGGFKLYYVTSKDEKSAYQLCNVYGEFGQFKPGEVSDKILQPGEDWASFFASLQTCLIHRDCIIGKETVENVNKPEQMKIVAQKEGVSPSQVWRLQDRYDKEEFETLKAAGFGHQFIVTGGYAFPTDYAFARADGIMVIERSQMAQALSDYAKENGF